jgi:hypothetical protein
MMDDIEHDQPSLRERRLDAYKKWNESMKETGNDRIDGQFQIVPNAAGVIGENMQVTPDGITDEVLVELETQFVARYRRTFIFSPMADKIKRVDNRAIESMVPFCYRYMRYTCFGVNSVS